MPYIIALVISSIVGLGAYIPAPEASLTLGAVKAFTSEQLAPSPVNGNCLTTNGSINAWGSCGTGVGGTGIATTSLSANDFDASASTISIDYTNGQAASVSNKGFLTAADWATFNSKLSSYDAFSRLPTFATTTAATNTPIWTQGVFFSSSTKAASQFPYASTTAITAVTASSSNLYVSGASGALALIGTDGLLGKYGGAAACTNQVVTAISAVGATTCSSVSNAMLSNSSITINTTGIATGGGSVSLGSAITINASSSPTVGFVIATSTTQNSIFPYASTTGLTAFYASSTSYFGAGLADCNTGNMLTWTAGRFGCEDDSTGAGAGYPFTTASTFGTTSAATTSSIWTRGVFFASSSATSTFDGALRIRNFLLVSTSVPPTTTNGPFSTGIGFGNVLFSCDSCGATGGNVIGIANYGGGTVGINTFSARGTTASPAATQSSDVLYFMGARGFGSTGWETSSKAAIQFVASQAHTDANNGTYITLETTANNTITRVERVRIDQSGFVGIATTTPGTMLSVSGNGVISGNLSAARYSATSTLAASIFPYASSTAVTAGAFFSTNSTTTNSTWSRIVFGSQASFGATGTTTITAAGLVGVASSTPWGLLSIQPSGISVPAFVIGSSTVNNRGMIFGIDNTGGVFTPAATTSTSTAIIMNWATSRQQTEYMIGTSATTITFINATTSKYWGSTRRVWICNGAATAGALTWRGVEFGSTAPTQTTTANACDMYCFNVTAGTSTPAANSTPSYKVAGSQCITGFQ